MKIRTALALVTLCGAVSTQAAVVLHGIDVGGTTTAMHGGDRELKTLKFEDGAGTYTGANFSYWADASLRNFMGGAAGGPFGWSAQIARDMGTSGNQVSANPDRADGATPFGNEGSSQGTLAEVFGTSVFGYKNLSWIIDGEDAAGKEQFVMDLFFAPGKVLNSDSNNKSVELAILERGMNSDIRVMGLKADGSTTGSILIDREDFDYAGWKLNTLEIDEDQKVAGIGISFDDSWDSLVGVRLQMESGFNGPDIVAVGSAAPVPAPTGLGLLAAAGLAGMRRRR